MQIIARLFSSLNNADKKRKGSEEMKLSRYEQETIILFNADESNAEIYTADKTVMKRLDQLCNTYPDIYKIKKEDSISKTYSVPKSYISYRKPRKLSSEQRELARKRMIELNLHDN